MVAIRLPTLVIERLPRDGYLRLIIGVYVVAVAEINLNTNRLDVNCRAILV